MDEAGLSAESHGDSVVITVHGDLDIITSPRLDESLSRVQGTRQRVIVDLSDVDFLDTSALAVIVGHWKRLESSGGMLALAGARYRYTKTLWITGLADKLTLYETVADALSAQAGTAGPTAT